jgi:transposase-like protein
MARKPPEPPPFDPALLDALAADLKTPADLDALFRQMKKALVERALSAELTQHLGYAPGAPKPEGQANHRNGTTPKTVLTDTDRLPLAIPRDRAGSFRPSWCPRGSAGCRASTRRSSRSTLGASPCARSGAT